MTLLNALDSGNLRVVRKCLKAGQSLKGKSLLINAVDRKCMTRLCTLLVFKKHIDIHESESGYNALWQLTPAKSDVPYYNLLIQAGCDVNSPAPNGDPLID